jgi:hypothetical protein
MRIESTNYIVDKGSLKGQKVKQIPRQYQVYDRSNDLTMTFQKEDLILLIELGFIKEINLETNNG